MKQQAVLNWLVLMGAIAVWLLAACLRNLAETNSSQPGLPQAENSPRIG